MDHREPPSGGGMGRLIRFGAAIEVALEGVLGFGEKLARKRTGAPDLIERA